MNLEMDNLSVISESKVVIVVWRQGALRRIEFRNPSAW